MLSQITSFLLALSMLSLSTALPNLKAHNLKPAIFFLAGDSTTAIINTAKTGGGWGDGFLATLKNNATGFNYGHNGRTTVSFRNGGDWSNVLAGVAGNKTEFTPFVTIQVFAHKTPETCKQVDNVLGSSGIMTNSRKQTSALRSTVPI